MIFTVFECLSEHLRNSEKPQSHQNKFLINGGWLVNQKGPGFSTCSTKSCKVFSLIIAHD